LILFDNNNNIHLFLTSGMSICTSHGIVSYREIIQQMWAN